MPYTKPQDEAPAPPPAVSLTEMKKELEALRGRVEVLERRANVSQPLEDLIRNATPQR